MHHSYTSAGGNFWDPFGFAGPRRCAPDDYPSFFHSRQVVKPIQFFLGMHFDRGWLGLDAWVCRNSMGDKVEVGVFKSGSLIICGVEYPFGVSFVYYGCGK